MARDFFDKSPFIKKYSFYHAFYQVDWEKVTEATEFLKTIEDFTSLCLPSEDFKTNICYIKESKWDILPSHHLILKPYAKMEEGITPLSTDWKGAGGEALRFTITSNRFLRGMIRKIVGTVLLVGKDRISLDEFKQTVTDKKDFRVNH